MEHFLMPQRMAENLTVYDQIIIEIFEKSKDSTLLFGDQFFTKQDIEDVIIENNFCVKNIADIKYTYDARRFFPKAIRDEGHFAILGLGKGKYCFTKLSKENLITDLAPSQTIYFSDSTPTLVKEVMGNDEQATLSTISYNNLITELLGFETYRVQNHERTSLSIGQVEIDSIYVGEHNQRKYIVPISGKGGNDYLSYAQACNLNTFAKERYPDYSCISLGIKRQEGNILAVKFTNETNIDKIEIDKIFALIPQ